MAVVVVCGCNARNHGTIYAEESVTHTHGFFWKVPGKEAHYLYTDNAAQRFLDADFDLGADSETLRNWEKVPMPDKFALLLLQENLKGKET